MTGEVSINEEGVLQINDNQYNVGELQELISDEEGRGKLNSDFKKIVKGNIFSKGAVIEKANEVIIACIDGQKAIKFDIKLCARKFSEVKNCRIGRVLPPHITRIQQKCAQHIIREGTIPLPKDIFN